MCGRCAIELFKLICSFSGTIQGSDAAKIPELFRGKSGRCGTLCFSKMKLNCDNIHHHIDACWEWIATDRPGCIIRPVLFPCLHRSAGRLFLSCRLLPPSFLPLHFWFCPSFFNVEDACYAGKQKK